MGLKQEQTQKPKYTIELQFLQSLKTLIDIEEKYIDKLGRSDQLRFIDALNNLTDLLSSMESYPVQVERFRLIGIQDNIIKMLRNNLKRISSGIGFLE